MKRIFLPQGQLQKRKIVSAYVVPNVHMALLFTLQYYACF